MVFYGFSRVFLWDMAATFKGPRGRWGINLKPSFSGAVFSKPRLKPPALQRLSPPVNNGQNLVNCHLVGGIPTPLNNDGVRQLGLRHSQYDGKNKIHVPNHQPVMCWMKIMDFGEQKHHDNGRKPSKTIIFMEIHGLVPLINTHKHAKRNCDPNVLSVALKVAVRY